MVLLRATQQTNNSSNRYHDVPAQPQAGILACSFIAQTFPAKNDLPLNSRTENVFEIPLARHELRILLACFCQFRVAAEMLQEETGEYEAFEEAEGWCVGRWF